ncbi:MAG: Gfo/Idh/MocA family oxidoreductase [Verrucomicrobia bacterium]|nr:Gfo/Idh/MocA family oxidoreductase [Verrucomicrobiota bacterium]
MNDSLNKHQPVQQSRRDFLKSSTLAAGVAMAGSPFAIAQQNKRKFRVALIGCGGRGNGAINDHYEAVKFLNDKLNLGIEVELIATADWFKGKAEATGKRYGLPKEKCFGGADAYKKAIATDCDIVLMAQAPLFKPLHFETAIKAGKNVFFEKPVAVDPPGVRQVIAAGELAKKKGLRVVAGTQRRHDEGYNRRAREIKDGAYGRIMEGRVAWNMGAIFTNTPVKPTSPDQLISPWQIWVEMSGDHIVEQHVHNIDVANWYLDAHPISAGGFGDRAQRVAGNMYDFFSGDLEYPNGIHIHSMCRQVPGCWDWVGEGFTFEKSKPSNFKLSTPDPYEPVGYHRNPYVGEHAHLIYAILKEKELNEARNVAESTGSAILIRESAYSGLRTNWDAFYEDPSKEPDWYNLKMKPTAEDFETGDVVMLKDGDIRVAGKYRPNNYSPGA